MIFDVALIPMETIKQNTYFFLLLYRNQQRLLRRQLMMIWRLLLLLRLMSMILMRQLILRHICMYTWIEGFMVGPITILFSHDMQIMWHSDYAGRVMCVNRKFTVVSCNKKYRSHREICDYQLLFQLCLSKVIEIDLFDCKKTWLTPKIIHICVTRRFKPF